MTIPAEIRAEVEDLARQIEELDAKSSALSVRLMQVLVPHLFDVEGCIEALEIVPMGTPSFRVRMLMDKFVKNKETE